MMEGEDPEKQPRSQEEYDRDEKTPASRDTVDAGSITLNVGYVKSLRGIIKIFEFFLLLIAWACAADQSLRGGRYSFFMFTAVTAWLIVIIIYCLYLFCVVEKCPGINWTMTVLVNTLIWTFLLLISASLFADHIRKIEDRVSLVGLRLDLDGAKAAVAFGFLSMIAFIIDIVFHVMELRS